MGGKRWGVDFVWGEGDRRGEQREKKTMWMGQCALKENSEGVSYLTLERLLVIPLHCKICR